MWRAPQSLLKTLSWNQAVNWKQKAMNASFIHLQETLTKLFTFFVLRDFLRVLALGPLTLGWPLLPEGKVPVAEWLQGGLMGAGFFPVWLLWDVTLLFSVKGELLSSAAPLTKWMGCPLLISSRYCFSCVCVAGSLNHLKKSSSTFIFRTGWRPGILALSRRLASLDRSGRKSEWERSQTQGQSR